MIRVLPLVLALTLPSCSTSYIIKNTDGSTVTGSILNGAVSYSAGDGCIAATPNAQTPPPALPTPLTIKRMCQGTNCIDMVVTDTPALPLCKTQVVNVKSEDFGDYAKWLLGGIFGGWALFK